LKFIFATLPILGGVYLVTKKFAQRET